MHDLRRGKNRREQGSVVPLLMGFMVVLITITMGMLSLAQKHQQYVADDGKRQAALSLAEAGIDHVIWRLRQTSDGGNNYGPNWRDVTDEQDVNLGNGTYYLVPPLKLDSNSNIKGVRMQGWIPSRNAPGAVSAEIYVELTKPGGPLFDMAVLVKDTMVLTGSFTTDSINSAVSMTQRLGNGHIGTLSSTANSIDVAGNPNIYGDIYSPTGSAGVVRYPTWWVDSNFNSKGVFKGFNHAPLTNPTIPTNAIRVKPVLDGPTLLKPQCCNNAFSGPSGEAYIQFIRENGTPVNDNTTLAADGLPYIPAGIYHILKDSNNDSIKVTNHRVLRFGPGLTQIYVDGKLTLSNSGKIFAMDQKPPSVLVFGTTNCTTVDLSGDTPLIGGLYAPSANVIIGGSCRVIGAVVGKSADLSGGSWVYYDEAFGNGAGGSGSNYKITTWTGTK